MENDRPLLESLGVTLDMSERLRAAGYVIVPINPTAGMLEAGWAEAHDERAEGVWRDMIAEWITPSKAETR